MRRSHLVCLWLLSPFCSASTHEFLHEVPSDYVQLGVAPQDELLSLRIYLAERDKPYLKVAQEVSDPNSEQYGQYLGAHELRDILPDMSLAFSEVTGWLQSEGLSNYTTSPEWIDATAAVADWNRVLNTTFLQFRHTVTGRTMVRTTKYSIPVTQEEAIDYIYPTVHFFRLSTDPETLHKRQHIPTGPSNCSNSVCPSQLRTKYKINYSPPDGKSGSTIAIAGFLNNFPNVTDVKAFLTKYDKKNPRSIPAINVVSVNKGTLKPPADGGSLTVEAELDLDYSMAFTGPLPVTFYSVGGHAPKVGQAPGGPISPTDNEPYAEFFEYVLGLKNPPKVISISYNDDEKNVPVAYAKRVCDLFAKAAARGISIVGSSGDGGASGAGGNTSCLGVSGKKRLFVPTFPSSCPWMTSVGATADYGGVASFSSGGMSNVFKRASWQDKAVSGYITALKGKHKGFYNTTGRAQPDVSLLGDDYLTLTGGNPSTHDGTSASAPVFAAMIALINDMRLREKKPVLGFLNPLLYSAKTSSAFRDVKDGSNTNGCADGNFFETGWEALAGWDAATGLGEPDFAKLAAILKA
ncbi:tripeptidyl-peptidase sed4 [Dactylonectria macrodidyma]|uniref:tripeptidyl-peptidase II n=1 Tax=Dactylonectria macrodidyma TaxID=307937 RepID=A0A9P9F8E4_9HYPO|nr:tripeptidyl-peptidase sed4 [Dactylonectria macrodidyma]